LKFGLRFSVANGHSRETADNERLKDEIEHADSRQQTMVDKLDYYATSTLASTFDQFSEFHEKIDHCGKFNAHGLIFFAFSFTYYRITAFVQTRHAGDSRL
jgi:hypothetical protein